MPPLLLKLVFFLQNHKNGIQIRTRTQGEDYRWKRSLEWKGADAWGGWGAAPRWRTVLRFSWWDSSDGLLVAELVSKYCWLFEIRSWKYHCKTSFLSPWTKIVRAYLTWRGIFMVLRGDFVFWIGVGESESNWRRRTSATGQLVGQRRRKRRSRDASWSRAWTRYLIRPAITIHIVPFYGLGIYTLVQTNFYFS